MTRWQRVEGSLVRAALGFIGASGMALSAPVSAAPVAVALDTLAPVSATASRLALPLGGLSSPYSPLSDAALFPLGDAWAAPTSAIFDSAGAATNTTDADETELVKKTLNPVANLISLPFQYNVDFGIGPNSTSKSILNIQPVIPISLNQDWNLISRTILPVIYAGSPSEGISSQWGLGDTTASLFLSPKQPVGGWIVGFGPVVFIPTATNDALGLGKWGLGPTAVALRQENGWTYGMLANQIWSVAGDGNRRPVNATFLQPFVSYSFPTYTSLTINTETTYAWTNNQATIPLNLTVSQVLKIGGQPVSIQLGPRYYAQRPPGGPTWGLRFTFTLLFPQ